MASLRSLLFSQFVSGAENTFLKVGTLGTTVQPLLVSNTNIKTVVGQTLLGSGNVALSTSDIPNLDASKITSGTIDAARLPSYVDDVLEYTNLASFPATGEAAKIYVALDSNKVYRWSGSTYVEISPAPDLSGYLPLSGGTITGSLTLNTGTANGVAYLNGSKVLTTGSALTFDGTELYTTGNIRVDNDREVRLGTNATYYGSLKYDSSTGNTVLSGRIDGYPLQFNVGGIEQMRLTSTGLGIGTSSPDQALVVNKASGSTYVKVSGANNVNNDLALHFTDGTNNAYFGMMRGTSGGIAGALHSYTGGAIRTTLDSSGNLGIGTSSPAQKLHVGGNQILQNTSSSIANNWIRWQNSSGTFQAGIASYFNIADTGNIEFLNGSTTNMVLSSSGNLGLGVAPSAWGGNYEAIEFPGISIANFNGGTNQQAQYILNAYDSAAGTWRYKVTGAPAAMYRQSAGLHEWHTAPSGTAGNITSFTQVMTLDAAGALLVGMTSRPNDARIASSGPIYVDAAPYGIGNFAVGSYAATSVFANSGYGLSAISFGRYNGSGTYTSQVLIDPSGNLGVGTTSPAAKLHVNGPVIIANAGPTNELTFTGTDYTNIYSETTGGMQIGINSSGNSASVEFLTNNAERFRIGPAGQIGLSGANYGTAGQVLTSNGSGSAPTWQDAGGGGGEAFSAF